MVPAGKGQVKGMADPDQFRTETDSPATSHEQPLVRRCQAGNGDAFEQLFETYREDVFRFAYLVVRDPGLAQDVTQETFIKVFRSIANFAFRSSFKSWLYRVAVNEAISLLRRRRIKEEFEPSPDAAGGAGPSRAWQPEEAVLESEVRWALRSAIGQLDPLHRSVVVLKYYHEFSDAEIANILSCPPGTVKSRLHRARELLRRSIAQRVGDGAEDHARAARVGPSDPWAELAPNPAG